MRIRSWPAPRAGSNSDNRPSRQSRAGRARPSPWRSACRCRARPRTVPPRTLRARTNASSIQPVRAATASCSTRHRHGSFRPADRRRSWPHVFQRLASLASEVIFVASNASGSSAAPATAGSLPVDQRIARSIRFRKPGLREHNRHAPKRCKKLGPSPACVPKPRARHVRLPCGPSTLRDQARAADAGTFRPTLRSRETRA